MVQDDEAVGLDGLSVVCDDERVVSAAGIALVAMVADRLGIEERALRLVRLRRDRPGAANAGRKVMALIFAIVLGADCIDDCQVLRAGARGGCWAGGFPPRRRWGRFCGRSRLGMSGSWTLRRSCRARD